MSLDTVTISIRVPEILKNKLSRFAKQAGKSMNLEISNRLEASFLPTTTKINNIFDALNLDKILRIRSTSTSADASRLLNICQTLEVEKIIFGAKKDLLNNAAMVVVIHTPIATFLMDSSLLNMAREPRIYEIQDIFKNLDKLGLLANTFFCDEYIEKTSELPKEEALDSVLSNGNLHQLIKLEDYLDILSVHKHYDIKEFKIEDI
jgi:hypothetical protein